MNLDDLKKPYRIQFGLWEARTLKDKVCMECKKTFKALPMQKRCNECRKKAGRDLPGLGGA